MKTEKSIFVAFILNLCFSVFEFFGGIFTGSVAVMSDAVHDIGDAASIGISFFLEKKSKRPPDKKYTYGYERYSVIGGAFSTLILLFGSVVIIYNAIGRIISPVSVNHNGMIAFAIAGVIVNTVAAAFTHHGHSVNQKAVNLHMLEDVLGWIVVLIGAVVIRLTGFVLIDPIMSVGVSLFVLVNAIKTLKEITDIFLEKVPDNIDVEEIESRIKGIGNVIDVYDIRIMTMDGKKNFITMHIVADADNCEIKRKIREELYQYGINTVTVEFEKEERCNGY